MSKRVRVAKALGRLQKQKVIKSEKQSSMLVTSILNYVYSCAFRRKPLTRTILAAKQIPIEYLIKKKILRSPKDYNYFIPEVHNDRAKSFLEQAKEPMASSDHLSNSLSLLSVNWRKLNGPDRGDVFERMHMSWWLAMRSHQASRTFLPDKDRAVDSSATAKLLYMYHPNKRLRMRISDTLDTMPKGNLRITHNEVKPLCNPSQTDEPFLLNYRYRMMQMPGSYSIDKVSGLQALSEANLQQLLEGNIALKNVDCGPGYDFVIVDWVPEGASGFKLVFSFLEMRFSSNHSSLTQKMSEVERKLASVKREFEAVQHRLPDVKGIRYDYRLIMECFRDLEPGFDARDLPDRVFLYDRASLGMAYGPSLTNNSNLTSFDE